MFALRAARPWLARNMSGVRVVGQEASQHRQRVRRLSTRPEIEEAAQVGDDHVAHRLRHSFQIEFIAGEEPAIIGGLSRAHQYLVWREPGKGGAFFLTDHRDQQ